MQEQEIDKQRQKYIQKREEYKIIKIKLLREIKQHQTKIEDLEDKIKKIRPMTKNGRKICSECDVISLKYVGRTPQGGMSGGENIYECEICGKINLDPGFY